MNKISRDWIRAACQLSHDPKNKVVCPSCKNDNLKVIDIKDEATSVRERYLVCPSCGAKNVIRL